MPLRREDAPLEELGVAPSAQHLGVVVRFEHHVVSSPDIVGDVVRDVPDIGSKREAEVPLSNMVAHILCTVVWHREGLDGKACHREWLVNLDVTA